MAKLINALVLLSYDYHCEIISDGLVLRHHRLLLCLSYLKAKS